AVPVQERSSGRINRQETELTGLDAPLPILIGVTGHRDLRPEDVPRLEATLRSAFADLQKGAPHSPFILLSPLAEGADRLAARVALSLGIVLIVPLPIPQALYERDFKTAESLAEFRDLMGRARARLHLRLLDGVSEASIAAHGPE